MSTRLVRVAASLATAVALAAPVASTGGAKTAFNDDEAARWAVSRLSEAEHPPRLAG